MKSRHSLSLRANRSCILALLLLSSGVWAQEFGKNKVTYESFDFKVMRTANFDLYYYPPAQQPARDAGRMLERRYSAYSKLFDAHFASRQPVILYANHPDFQQTNVIGQRIPQGTGGFTESLATRIVLPITGVYSDTEHVLAHELVHAFEFRLSGSVFDRAASVPPLWFSEGLAEYLSLGDSHTHTAMWMRDAVLHERLPTLGRLTRRPDLYSPYRYGHAIWSYIGGVWGHRVTGELAKEAFRRGWKPAIRSVLNIEPADLIADWRKVTESTARPVLERRQLPAELGDKILGEPGGTYLSPSLSPDGSTLAFLSRRDPFTIDLYLADTTTGEIVKKLADSASDRHFEALRFVDSAGSWSPEGNSFAFVVDRRGDNALAVTDVETGRIRKVIHLDEVGAIYQVAWSPEGNRIALSASAGGVTDLYVYDLVNEELRQLTNDLYAELHPAWSPDGKKLAFSTERGPETDIEALRIGPMKIGLLDLASGEIELISIDEGVGHINPHFSPDGEELYFVADSHGVPDLFRYSIRDGSYARLTRLATGIAGLTATSPALSVASATGEIVCTVVEDGGYSIYRLKRSRAIENGPVQRHQAALLPPHYPERERLAPPTEELPQIEPDILEYNPTLSLVQIGRLLLGINVTRFGVGLYGNFAAYFADMLGNHRLFTATQISGNWKDIGAQLAYQNLKYRLNFGVSAEHSAQTYTSLESQNEIDGELTSTFVQVRQFINRADLLTRYPLSKNRRLELSTGYKRIGYDDEAEVIRTQNRRVVERSTEPVKTPPPLHLSQSRLAYVADYSFSGFTAGLRGRRLRLEIEPTFGSLLFLSVLADIRQYLFVGETFSLAFRAFHFGRYFGDAESTRLSPLMLGDAGWVRGYSFSSFRTAECAGEESCAVIDRLIGSRIAVLNAELRLPVFGSGGLGLVDFPYLPLSLLLFFDAGLAWTRTDQPALRWAIHTEERIPVFSAGAAVRARLGGVAVLQVFFAYPFQRPDRGGHLGLVLTPGW